MKIGQYKQALKYMTRPGTPEQKKKAEENNAKYLADRKAKTLKKYGLENHVVGTLNKFEDGPNITQPKKVETKPTNGGPDILRNILIEEMKSRELDRDEIRYLMDTKDRSSYPKEPTPKQLKNKPLEKTPTNIAESFINNTKPAIKKTTVKKTIKPYEPQKIDTFISDPYSAIEPKPVAPIDPKLKELEERFLAAQEQSYQEKIKKNTKGLRSFAPIKVNRDV